VVAVTKLLRMYKMLRQNTEAIVSLKQLTPNHQIPLGLLHDGPGAIRKALKDFSAVAAADRANESMPPKHSPRTSPRTSISSAAGSKSPKR
jgi:hypothetical protein